MEEEKDDLVENNETVNDNEVGSSKIDTQETEEVASASSKNKWILWSMGVILAGLIAFLVFYVVNKPTANTPSNNTTNSVEENTVATTSTDPGKVMAIVGDEEITDGMLEKRAKEMIASMEQVAPEQLDMSNPEMVSQIEQAKNYVLGQVVQEMIYKEMAEREGIEITDDDLQQTALLVIEEMIKPQASQKAVAYWTEEDQTQWDSWLTQQGFGSTEALAEDFVLRYRDQLITDTYKRLLYGDELNQITFTEDQARSWFNETGRMKISHILFSFDSENDPPEKKTQAISKAEDALQKVRTGANFASTALELSEDPTVEQNSGDIGWYTIQGGTLVGDVGGSLVPEFSQAAIQLEVGEISDIVETQYGFHIIKVMDVEMNGSKYDIPEGIRLATIQCLDEGKSTIPGMPMDQNTDTSDNKEKKASPKVRANEALEKITSGEITFAEAASQYSDDMISKDNGGEMPSFMATDQSGYFWVQLDLATQMDGQGMYPYDKKLVEKVWKVEPGTVYPEPIRTDNGWVIAKVIDHRDAVIATFESTKDRVIADQLSERKQKFESDWMSEARETINVEYTEEQGMIMPQGMGRP